MLKKPPSRRTIESFGAVLRRCTIFLTDSLPSAASRASFPDAGALMRELLPQSSTLSRKQSSGSMNGEAALDLQLRLCDQGLSAEETTDLLETATLLRGLGTDLSCPELGVGACPS